MLILPQPAIEITIVPANKKHYVSKGYYDIKIGQKIFINSLELSYGSDFMVEYSCDYCNKLLLKKNSEFIKGRMKIDKDSCSKCGNLKLQDVLLHDHGVKHIMDVPKFRDKSGRKPILYSIVEELFVKHDFFIVGKYKKGTIPLEFICNKHRELGIQIVSYSNLNIHRGGCRACNMDSFKQKMRGYTIEEVKLVFDEKGCTLLSTHYENIDDHLDYICENGHKGKVSFYEFKKDSYCRKCRTENTSGDNHWNWQGGITSSNEKIRKSSEYLKWRNSVYERDSYICQCCLQYGIILNAHHIDNFSDHHELRLKINNGISLCISCHSITEPDSFHDIYTVFNNTKEQLIEYIINKRQELGISAEMPFLLQS